MIEPILDSAKLARLYQEFPEKQSIFDEVFEQSSPVALRALKGLADRSGTPIGELDMYLEDLELKM